MIKNKRLETISHDDLSALISASYPEGQDIDYKRDLPDLDGKRSDDAKKSLLADVASFSNAGGGDILFGVEEGRTDGKPNGLPVDLPGIESPNSDALQRRWVGIIESGLDPRMAPKVRAHPVPIPNTTKAVVVLRVPRSYAAPHMVKETYRFYARHAGENRVLDTTEIRAALALSDTWAAHVKRWRDERIGRIVGDDTPVKLTDEARLVLHIVPLAAATRGFAIDLQTLKSRNPAPVYFGSSYSPGFNVDGLFVVGDPGDEGAHTYTQFFREGAVEAVLTTIADEKLVHPTRVEPHVINATKLYVPLVLQAGGEYPFTVSATLLGMKGFSAPPIEWSRLLGRKIPRDVVFLPDVVLEGEEADLPGAFRPMFDALWQSVGHERSPSYGPDGKWKGK